MPEPRSALTSAVERHSIDWVPHAERHGRVAHLGAVWFVSNVNLTAMATGAAALAVGAPLFWTVLATVLGSLFGTFFMAFHSAQGPHLGLPQLVQSRPQFGYVGAALTVWVFALVNYLAYNISDAIMAGSAVHLMTGLPASLGYPLAAVLAALVALFGYRWIHRINRWLALPSIILLVALTAVALNSDGLSPELWSAAGFRAAPVMTVFVIVAGFQLGWAPFVSDYSRYLHAHVPAGRVFWWTYLPSAISAVWVFVIGSILTAAVPGVDLVTALATATDRALPGLGAVAIAVLLVGLLDVMAINQYGGALTMISIRDSFRPVVPTRRVRATAIGAMLVLVWGVAQFVGTEHFAVFYGNVLIFLAYLFTPWTAINLVDYFLVRRGQYVIAEIFTADGIYGRWGWRGNTAYLIGLVSMVPFMVTAPFTGPAATALGGVDYSMFVGLPVAAVAYLVFSRSLDLAEERRLVAREGLLQPPRPAPARPTRPAGR
ncbi:purine-cytosine permease family protein [Goodfellowiella coeruleoviolacea]|uniref:Purine-cytosine permease n=1 Tax=Goodfellowiella coeruleoviolacea TaxID=334858 RepID=A0AAE3GI16_9PSEU|nr:cytosine permease [Goodfellowiella coeruleoviolacea]MCP2167772.1 Purine-cytosine permease [Goodfellowiella coeruleoviolacea]